MPQDPKSSGASNRGFASMDPAMQRQIASKGGRSVPPEERSFSKDRALAAAAGRKGGEASHGGRRDPDNRPTAQLTGRIGRDASATAERVAEAARGAEAR